MQIFSSFQFLSIQNIIFLLNSPPENYHQVLLFHSFLFLLVNTVNFLSIRNNNSLLAFARLHETQVEFDKIKYPVLGIATLVAVQKGHGYGQQLVSFIKNTLRILK